MTLAAATSTPSPSATPASTTSPMAEPSGTPPATPGSSVVTGLGQRHPASRGQRAGSPREPKPQSPLAQGIKRVTHDTAPDTLTSAGDVRLEAGDYVSVDLGPLAIGDVVWYRVWPAEDAQLHYSTLWWDTNGDDPVGGVNPGWVASSVGEDQYLTLYRPTDPSEYEAWSAEGPMTLMASGTGNYVSEPYVQHDLFDFEWAAAVDDQSAPCSFSVTLLPENGAEPVIAIETSIAHVEQGPESGIAGLLRPLGPRPLGTPATRCSRSRSAAYAPGP